MKASDRNFYLNFAASLTHQIPQITPLALTQGWQVKPLHDTDINQFDCLRLPFFSGRDTAVKQKMALVQSNQNDGYGVLLTKRGWDIVNLINQYPGIRIVELEDSFGPGVRSEIIAMLFDNVIEFQTASGLSDRLPIEALSKMRSTNLTTASQQALEIAALSKHLTCKKLGQLLYSANRRPVTKQWIDKYQSKEDTYNLLGMNEHVKPSLEQQWALEQSGASWDFWQRKNGAQQSLPSASLYKLYIGIKVESFSSIMLDLIRHLCNSDAIYFKHPSTVNACLRPDVFMVYFLNYLSLSAFAQQTKQLLRECAVHSVPLSMPVDNLSAVSWGIDPPLEITHNLFGQPESWRTWVSRHIAVSLRLISTLQLEPYVAITCAVKRLEMALKIELEPELPSLESNYRIA